MSENKTELFKLSTSPHIRSNESINKIMGTVIIALLPAMIASIYFFGVRALIHIITAVTFSIVAEAVVQKIRKVDITVNDLSAALTGLLLAFNVSPSAPYWISAVGSVFAVVVVKQLFGGLGYNFMNPALAARAFLLASWPVHMTASWMLPRGTKTLSGFDAITSATPLNALKNFISTGSVSGINLKEAILPLFTGQVGGCIGETSAIALIIGGVFLLYKRYIDYKIPLTFISTVFVLTWIFNGTGSFFTQDALIVPVFHIFSGGLMLGAFFMATDMVTSPITPIGTIIFGVGCGVITVLIRLIGGYPEGVSYSIILMNITVPLLERIRRPKKYGEKN